MVNVTIREVGGGLKVEHTCRADVLLRILENNPNGVVSGDLVIERATPLTPKQEAAVRASRTKGDP